MTDHTPAAQAAMQEAVRDAIRKAYDDGYNDAKMAPDNCSTYCAQRAEREGTAALLSKLRAPVADERAKTALRTIAEYPVPEQDNMPARNMRAVAVAALASAPVAGEAQPNIMRFNPFAGLGMNPAPNGM